MGIKQIIFHLKKKLVDHGIDFLTLNTWEGEKQHENAAAAEIAIAVIINPEVSWRGDEKNNNKNIDKRSKNTSQKKRKTRSRSSRQEEIVATIFY